MNDTPVNRFIGGPPSAVFVRLVFLSLIVGAILMWLDIRPADLLIELDHMIRRIGNMGFGAVREIGTYLLTGALIVVPLWIVLRLLNMGGRR